nr:immunoglobulin light chain junction region [Macaca mulatta]MOW03225.1 immunoglobulin light chain junction region [Macaca mulatta]
HYYCQSFDSRLRAQVF